MKINKTVVNSLMFKVAASLGCTILLSGNAMAQRPPKAPDPVKDPPTKIKAQPAKPVIKGTVTTQTQGFEMVIGPDGKATGVRVLSPAEMTEIEAASPNSFGMTRSFGTTQTVGDVQNIPPELAAKLGILPAADMEADFLEKAGITDPKIHKAIVDFVEYQEKKYKNLRDQKSKLVVMLRDSASKGNAADEELAKLTKGISVEAAILQKEYLLDLEKLNADINYSGNPRLEAALDALGLLRKEPIFAAGLTLSELIYTDPLRKIRGEEDDFMASLGELGLESASAAGVQGVEALGDC